MNPFQQFLNTCHFTLLSALPFPFVQTGGHNLLQLPLRIRFLAKQPRQDHLLPPAPNVKQPVVFLVDEGHLAAAETGVHSLNGIDDELKQAAGFLVLEFPRELGHEMEV